MRRGKIKEEDKERRKRGRNKKTRKGIESRNGTNLKSSLLAYCGFLLNCAGGHNTVTYLLNYLLQLSEGGTQANDHNTLVPGT